MNSASRKSFDACGILNVAKRTSTNSKIVVRALSARAEENNQDK